MDGPIKDNIKQTIVPSVEDLIASRKNYYQEIVDKNVSTGITHVTVDSLAKYDHSVLQAIEDSYGNIPTLGERDYFIELQRSYGSTDELRRDVLNGEDVYVSRGNFKDYKDRDKQYKKEEGVNVFFVKFSDTYGNSRAFLLDSERFNIPDDKRYARQVERKKEKSERSKLGSL